MDVSDNPGNIPDPLIVENQNYFSSKSIDNHLISSAVDRKKIGQIDHFKEETEARELSKDPLRVTNVNRNVKISKNEITSNYTENSLNVLNSDPYIFQKSEANDPLALKYSDLDNDPLRIQRIKKIPAMTNNETQVAEPPRSLRSKNAGGDVSNIKSLKMDPEQYLRRLKGSLSKPEYISFQKILKKYKSKELTINVLLDKLYSVFFDNEIIDGNNEERQHLFMDFRLFVGRSQYHTFDEFINSRGFYLQKL